MVARAKAKRWVHLVAGMTVAVTGTANAAQGADGRAPAWLPSASRPEPVRVAQLQGRPSQGRSALTSALENQRRGEYEAAAGLLLVAQQRQADLTAIEQQELARLVEENARAMRARRTATEQLRQVEAMAASGNAEAVEKLKKVLADEQYLRQEDRQKSAALAVKLRVKSVTLTALIETPAKETTEKALAAEKAQAALKAARAEMALGMFGKTEILIKEAESFKVSYGSKDDTPAKVRADLHKFRNDRKAMIAESRAALQAKNYERADLFARHADKAFVGITGLWGGESPAKLLKEIQAAKTAATVATVATTGAAAPIKDKTETKSEAKKTVELPKAAPTLPPKTSTADSGKPTEEARQLLKLARKAMLSGDLAKAKKLNEEAKEKKPVLTYWEDNPDKVHADLARMESKRPAPAALVKQASTTGVDSTKTIAPANTENPKVAPLVKDAKPAYVAAEKSTAGKDKRVGKDEAVNVLQKARALLADHKYEQATEAVLKVKAVTSLRWGLFEDNPDKVLQDIEKGRVRYHKEESVKVLANARLAFEKNDYENAKRLAYRAQKLHGPYSVWDLGDRPSKLLAEIDSAKEKVRKPVLPPPVQAAAKDKPPMVVATKDKDVPAKPIAATAPVTQIAQTTPTGNTLVPDRPTALPAGRPTTLPDVIAATPGTGTNSAVPSFQPAGQFGIPMADANTVRARQILAVARKLQAEGNLLEARRVALEAQGLRASFTPDEDSPEQALLQMAATARQRVDSLVSKAVDEARYGRGDAPLRAQEAEKQLAQARLLAAGFGQDLQPIDSKVELVRQMRTGVANAVAKPETVPNPMVKTTGASTPEPGNLGRELLDKARLELTKGELFMARKMAQEAFNGPYGVKDDAMAILRSVDAEEGNQRLLQAGRAFDAAQAAFNRKEYANARNLLQSVEVRSLDPRRRGRLREIMDTAEMQPSMAAAKPAREPQVADLGANVPTIPHVSGKETPVLSEPGRARASDAPSESNLLATTEALRNVAFQKMRKDGLDKQKEAAEKFRTGQTDEALELLQTYLGELSDSQLDPKQVAMLKRPVESRLEQYRLLKAQTDFQRNDKRSTADQKNAVTARQRAQQNKEKQVAEKMKQFNTLFKEAKYLEAERYAMLAHELDPDNAMASAAVQMAKMQRNVMAAKDLKAKKADIFLTGMNETEDPGDSANAIREGGMTFNKDRWDAAGKRGQIKLNPFRQNSREKEIETKLNAPVNLNFNATPLYQVIEDLRSWQGINIYVDTPALEKEGVSMDRPVSVKFEQISLKSALNLLLHGYHLTYVIKDEVLQITTESEAKGKLQTTTYAVADLVIPIENFGSVKGSSVRALGLPDQPQAGATGAPTPFSGRGTLGQGEPAGSPSGSTTNGGAGGQDPSNSSWGKKSNSRTMEDTLIKLITNTVQPKTWSDMGGAGTIDYFPLTMSLVINQTPDIQEQITDLLASLRRLQDQEVALEVRLISIADDFFERIGVNFNMNITNQSNTRKYQPQITSGQFQQDGFINQFSPNRFLAGLQPNNTFTTDLNIPINNQTFAQALPPFGGYSGVPGYGGLTLGLGFLSDIQVFLFMEAVQGDNRTNVMQAPKLTMFNGQTATLNVTDFQYFTTGATVTNTNGQFIFNAQNQPFPLGTNISLQPVISADRRFVRLSTNLELTNLASPIVNLFPVVVPIFPQFDGTATGQPIVFTQFFQQPSITTVGVQTTVSVPDGGTVLMGGLKRLSEGRNEYGPPILSKLPYINRLFKNVGYGREAHSLLIMVTPRIIIMEEEEEKQTGVRGTSAVESGR